MAKFGKWGALAGAGEGIMTLARNQTEAQAAEKQATIDEAREKRLLEYKAKLEAQAREQAGSIESRHIGERGDVQAGLQEQAGNIESGHIGERGDVQAGLQDSAQEHQTSERRSEEEWKSQENELDRQSAERIANARSATDASIKAAERFEFTTTKTTDYSGNFPVETEVQAIRDKDTRNTYIQHGTRYVLQGIEPSTLGEPSQSDVTALMEGRADPNDFAEYYGFLPAAYIQGLSSKRSK